MKNTEQADRGNTARYYLPEEGIYLEKWKQGRPCATAAGKRNPIPLDPDEMALLEQCDGMTPIEPSLLTDRLEAMRIIRRCGRGTAPATPIRIIEHPNYYVRQIDWAVTDRCNYNCRHCFHAVDNTTHRNEFSLEEAMRFLDEVRECGIRALRLTGGEPTLHPRFREIVTGMRERGLFLNTLVTNGSRITPEFLAFLKERHPEVIILLSFDGIGWHDWMRQHPGSEEKTLEAIRLSREAGLKVYINANVHRKNADGMFATVEKLVSLGADRIRIIRTSESPRWELNKENDTLLPEEYYDFSMRFARQYRDSGLRVPVTIWQSLYLNGERKTFSILPVKAPAACFTGKERICSAMMIKPSVQANGDVVPCSPMAGLFEFLGVHLGNVHERSLKDLLTEGAFAQMITATAGEKMEKNPECAACRYFKECQGGCPALSFVSGGSVFSSDRYKCAFFRNGYAEKYRRLMEEWKEIEKR